MTQEDIVKKQLCETGEVSRNWCLQRNITRLASIVNKLNGEGFKIEPFTKNGRGDYTYILVK